jgi:NADPH:quinone reductase-like Zn-dependent oxidoreductase
MASWSAYGRLPSTRWTGADLAGTVEVAGVCSTRNVELVRSIGADRVVDYTQEDFTLGERRYDVLLDLVANRTLAEYRRVLARKGVLVQIGPAKGEWIGAVLGVVQSGQIRPVIDRAYPLSEVPEAVRYLEQGHARGKVVITV